MLARSQEAMPEEPVTFVAHDTGVSAGKSPNVATLTREIRQSANSLFMERRAYTMCFDSSYSLKLGVVKVATRAQCWLLLGAPI